MQPGVPSLCCRFSVPTSPLLSPYVSACVYVCGLVCWSLYSCPKPFSEKENHPKYNQCPISSACNFHSQSNSLTYSPPPPRPEHFFFPVLPYRKFGESSNKIAKLVKIRVGKKIPIFCQKKNTYPPQTPPQKNVISWQLKLLCYQKLSLFGGTVLGLP